MTGRTFTPLSLYEECDLLCTKQGIIARLPGATVQPITREYILGTQLINAMLKLSSSS